MAVTRLPRQMFTAIREPILVNFLRLLLKDGTDQRGLARSRPQPWSLGHAHGRVEKCVAPEVQTEPEIETRPEQEIATCEAAEADGTGETD